MSVFATFTPSFSMTEFSGAEEEEDARKFRTESREKCRPLFYRWTSKGDGQICFGFGVVVVRMMNVNEEVRGLTHACLQMEFLMLPTKCLTSSFRPCWT